MTPPDFSRYLRLSQAARRLGLTPRSVDYMVQDGRLKSIRNPFGIVLVEVAEVEAMRQDRIVKGKLKLEREAAS